MSRTAPLVSVRLTRDGVWSVDERAASRIAIVYFPSKWGAIRHAVRMARGRRHCKVALLAPGGEVGLSREYRNDDGGETP